MMLLGAYRDEWSSSPLLEELERLRTLSDSIQDVRHIDIGPLSHPEATELALQHMGEQTPAARARAAAGFARESGGNPALVIALAVQSEPSAAHDPLLDDATDRPLGQPAHLARSGWSGCAWRSSRPTRDGCST